MARPVNANPDETRARILAIATQRFGEEGQKASAREVARAAGVSLATVHYHFGSKRGLHEACVRAMDEAFEGLRRELAALIGEGLPLAEVVEQAVRRSYRFAGEHRAGVRLTTRAAIDSGSIDPARQAALLVPGLSEGAELLSALTGAPLEPLRLTLRSVSYLVVRYALTDPTELALALGRPTDDPAHLRAAVEDHLVFVARSLIAGLGVAP